MADSRALRDPTARKSTERQCGQRGKIIPNGTPIHAAAPRPKALYLSITVAAPMVCETFLAVLPLHVPYESCDHTPLGFANRWLTTSLRSFGIIISLGISHLGNQNDLTEVVDG
jgi:hypothetical protein